MCRFHVDYKPGPVPIAGCPAKGEDHSSRRRVAAPLEHSHPGTGTLTARLTKSANGRALRAGHPLTAPLFELAPGRACLAAGRPAVARGLLPHDFTLTCAFCQSAPKSRSSWPAPGAGPPSAVSFLLRFPSGRPGSPLATSPPYGARTFLPRARHEQPRQRSSFHLRHPGSLALQGLVRAHRCPGRMSCQLPIK